MGCFDDVPLEDLEQCVNEENVAGVRERGIYVALADHIDAFPESPGTVAANVTLESKAKITTDITFLENKGWIELQVQADTGEVKDELVGNKGNKKVKSMFDFFLANTSAKNIGFINQYKNLPLVFGIPEKSGRVRLLGSKKLPAYFESTAGTSGKGPEDDNGWQVSVEVTTGGAAPIYEGNFTKPVVV